MVEWVEIEIEGASLMKNEANIQHVYVESQGTDHEWQTWRRALKDFAPRLFQHRRTR
jgi:enterochelin esterase-like enzyme